MGITPDTSFRANNRKPSLRTAGLAVIAAIRMRRMREEWAGSRKLHDALVKKLESMRRGAAVQQQQGGRRGVRG